MPHNVTQLINGTQARPRGTILKVQLLRRVMQADHKFKTSLSNLVSQYLRAKRWLCRKLSSRLLGGPGPLPRGRPNRKDILKCNFMLGGMPLVPIFHAFNPSIQGQPYSGQARVLLLPSYISSSTWYFCKLGWYLHSGPLAKVMFVVDWLWRFEVFF